MNFRCFHQSGFYFLIISGIWYLTNCSMLSAQKTAAGDVTTKNDESGEQPIEFTNSMGMKFRLIPAGEFMMGSSELFGKMKEEYGAHFAGVFHVREHPQHKVRITTPFRLGVTEVTQEQYWRVMAANPSVFSATGSCADSVQGIDTSSFPVDGVSWHEAVEFCRRLSAIEGVHYRLPTEAEWEYACRAGTASRWCCGDDPATLQEYAWCRDVKKLPAGEPFSWRTHPVAQKKPNE